MKIKVIALLTLSFAFSIFSTQSPECTAADLSTPESVSVHLEVDRNRDNRIDLQDDKIVADSTLFTFWVDDEISDAVDNPDRKRDLINSFAIQLHIETRQIGDGSLDNALSHYSAVISQVDGAVDVIFPDPGLLQHPKDHILRDEIANRFLDASWKQVTPQGVAIPESIVSAATKTGWKVDGSRTGPFILVRASKKTEHPLIVRVSDASTNTLLATATFSLKTVRIDELMHRIDLRHDNQSEIGDNGIGQDESLASVPRVARDFVFVHGYNVNEPEALEEAAWVYKGLWWAGFNGTYHWVSWNGSESQILVPTAGYLTPRYQTNVVHAFESAKNLATGLSRLRNPITIAAHSLGNILVSAAIEDDGLRPMNYIMLNAAVPMEAYDPLQANLHKDGRNYGMVPHDWDDVDPSLYASNWCQLFGPSDERSHLTWRGRFQHVPERTNLYNYYSSQEDVLGNPTRPVADQIYSAEGCWNNQERGKGLAINDMPRALVLRLSFLQITKGYGGWSFSQYWRSKQWRQLDPGTKSELAREPFFNRRSSDSPSDIAELYSDGGSSFCAQNRSQLLAEMIPALSFAAGANEFSQRRYTNGLINQTDLATCKTEAWPTFGNESRWTHGSFLDIYQRTYILYTRLVANEESSSNDLR